MSEITLAKYLENHTQQEAGEAIGCTQGAISQMLQADRDIRICLDESGKPVDHYEIKKPRKSATG
jgi:DNA-directed RNA polymerase specialized sigma24 family protein